MALMYEDITGKIISSAIEVHKHLGGGFKEIIYQRALSYELGCLDLNFEEESQQEIYYKDIPKPIGRGQADFVVEDKVLIEIKAVKALDNFDMAQIIHYLKTFRIEVGLLINFGGKSLEFRRVVFTVDDSQSQA
jgi:GxxExxY protein